MNFFMIVYEDKVNLRRQIWISKIIKFIENEVILEIKDKSAHSILLKDKDQVEVFVDFIQSVVDHEHKIISTQIFEQEIEIVKGWPEK
jgi:hypothetical protein